MKQIMLALISTITFLLTYAVADDDLIKSDPYQLSTHILDVSRGVGAKDVSVQLYKARDGIDDWVLIAEEKTDANGRIKTFLSRQSKIEHHGNYKLVFMTKPYFDALKEKSFYPYIEVIYTISDNTHYHVPITLSNFGYSTYRGN